MTQLSAICFSLLSGDVLSIMTGFKQFGVTNIPREIGRGVERRFGVEVSKTPVKFKSRYGHTGEYYQYRLNKASHNFPGMQKMAKYIERCIGDPQTQQQRNMLTKLKPLLK